MDAEPEHVNPFASPLAEEGAVGPDAPSDIAHLETIRREHLSREATIKSVGLVAYLGGILLALGFGGLLMMFAGGLAGAGGPFTPGVFEFLLLFAYAVFVGVTFWVGAGLRRFRPAARIAGVLLSVLWLLISLAAVNPLTLLISICGLWCLLGKKARYIFTPDYQQIIAATSHIRYQTSKWVWILLAVLVGLFVLAIAAAFVPSPQ